MDTGDLKVGRSDGDRTRPEPHAYHGPVGLATRPFGSIAQCLVDSLGAPAFIEGPDGRISAANYALGALIGVCRTDLRGRAVDEIVRPGNGGEAGRDPDGVVDTPDGPLYVILTTDTLTLPDGAAVGAITELQPLPQDGIAVAPQPLTDVDVALLARHGDGVAVLTEGRIEFTNAALCATLGCEPTDLEGESASLLLGPHALALVERTSQQSAPLRTEHDLLYAGGGSVRARSVLRPCLWRERPSVMLIAHFLADGGTPFVAQRRNTRLRRAMGALSEAASRGQTFEGLGAALLDALLEIFDCDRALLYSHCDPDASTYSAPLCRFREGHPPPPMATGSEVRPLSEPMRGYMRRVAESEGPVACLASEGLRGVPYPPEAAAWCVRSHLACALGPPHGPPCLLALHRCGDEGRWSSEDIDLLRDLSHRLEDLLGACYLLEEVRGSEELLHQAVADLERSNADLESFAYLASHDLKEPLRAVANSVQLLLRRFIDPSNTEATRLAQHAVSGAFRMTELVDGLLEYSRVGTQPLAIGPVDLAAALRGVLLDLGPRIEEAEALVVPGSLPVVQGEERMLRQVLQNLLSNALKFRGSAPLVVRFSAVRSGSLWTITVQDNGAGFAVQDARRIFNVFETLNGGGGGLGTGLGLALCKRIIQRLGGSIWAEGEPGTGATFHFTLPGADREAESPGSAEGHEDLY